MENTKYYIKGTLTGSQSYETFTEGITASGLVQWIDEIKEFIEDEKEELAQYIDDRYSCLYGVVTEIYAGVKLMDGQMFSLTEVTTTRELSDEEKSALLEYLIGQFSDGWGEGVEQREFTEVTEYETEEYYDEDEEEVVTDEFPVQTYLYLHFWQPKGFNLRFVELDEVNEAPTKPTKPRCKLIGEDGNIFNLLGIAGRALTRAGLTEQKQEMFDKVMKSGSYDTALQIIMEYVEVE